MHGSARPPRLALSLAPTKGEAFASWVDRLSLEANIPPGMLLDRCGVGLVARDGGATAPFGVELTDEQMSRLSWATGVEETAISTTLLKTFGHSLVRTELIRAGNGSRVAPAMARQWALFRSSRACVLCLSERPVWRLEWKLAASAVCTKHQVMLSWRCVKCETRFRQRGGARAKEPIPRREMADLLRCRGHRAGVSCGALLTDQATRPAPLDVAKLQTLYLHAVTSAEAQVAGVTVAAHSWHESFSALSSAVRFAITLDDEVLDGLDDAVFKQVSEFCRRRDDSRLNQVGNDNARYGAPADTPEWAAVFLRSVVPVLSSSTVEQAEPMLCALHERVERQRRVLGRPVIGPDIGLREPLRSVWASLELTKRPLVFGMRALHGRPDEHHDEMRFRSIPPLVTPVMYKKHITQHLPKTAEWTGRQFSALCVARHRGATSWPHAGEVLGIGRQLGQRRSDFLYRRVADRPEFWTSVAALSLELAQGPLIDYPARRRALASFERFPDGLFEAIARAHGAETTPTANRCAAAWAWGELTCCDWREAPSMTSWPTSATPESRREMARRFLKQWPVAMRQQLVAKATEVTGVK